MAPGGSASRRFRLLHTQLLVRGGARTPRRPLPPEDFWRAALPSEALVQRLRREGGAGAFGARRRLPAAAASGPSAAAAVWGQLTARGSDEARAAGARLQRWLAEREGGAPEEGAEQGGGQEEDQQRAEAAEAAAQPPRRRKGPWQGLAPLVAVATPDLRAELTARAVLSGLALPPDRRVSVDAAAGAHLRVATAWPGGAAGDGEGCGPRAPDGGAAWVDEDAAAEAEARRDAALDLLELLGLDSAAFASLSGASWAELLDVAECASIFGLLPQGELLPATRRALFGAPVRAAQALVADPAGGALAPLLRAVLSPSVRAARGATRESIRVTVLPGFSMLCWAAALGLRRALAWPSPSMCYLVETLAEEASGEASLRIWQFKDLWEVRPTWHAAEGPARLSDVLDAARPAMGRAGARAAA